MTSALAPAVPAIVTFGVFEGLHQGHLTTLRLCLAWARASALRAVVVTFHPHPQAVLRGQAPPFIMPLAERLAALRSLGFDEVHVLAFNEDLAGTPAEDFLSTVFLGRLGMAGLVVGFNSRLGRGGAADASRLMALGGELGFEVRVAPPVLQDGLPVSSSRVRRAVQAGDLAQAARCLDRPYRLSGVVMRGDGRGRTLGFPTANLDPTHDLCPPSGVYGAWATCRGSRFPAVVNIGTRPTFAVLSRATSIEAHILDFRGDLYGQALGLDMLRPLRQERRFASAEDLKAQIRADIAAWHAICAESAPEGARSL